MRTIKLTGNLVALQPIAQSAVTDCGIHLAQAYTKSNQIWRVLHVGPGRRSKKGVRIPIELKPGDRVITPQIVNNIAVYSDGVQIVNASEILARIEE